MGVNLERVKIGIFDSL